MERLSETQKRRSNSDNDFELTSPKQKKSRSSGTDTTAYLREKTEKDFKLRAEELKLKREQLDMEKQRHEASQNHMEMLMQSSQQQMNAMLLLVGNLLKNFNIEKTYTEKFQLTILIVFRSNHKRCSKKKVFLKISQNSQENTCIGVSLLRPEGLQLH